MAQSASMIINIISLSFSLSLSFLPWTTSAGYTLKLIHRDSPLSPLYQSNLTDLERFSKHVEISMARASYFQQHMNNQSSKARQNPSIRLPARLQEPLFTVEIGIGTPAVKRTLIFDTGSNIVWTQCSPCIRCFKQNEPLFNTQRSTTYKTIGVTHPLAKSFTCTPSGCTYYVSYYSGQYTAGDAAVETFTFPTNLRTPATVPNLAFGCGNSNVGRYLPEISGIFGMNREPLSFARQLESTTKSRFSYCLSPVASNRITSYVKFGDEARIRGWRTKKTPFLASNEHYGLNLIDLSVNGRKLGLGRAAFPDGCFVDSGASVSLLNTRAYSAVTNSIKSYFSKFRNVVRYVGDKASDKFLCFSYPTGFASFPSMTFNFKGADYQVPGSNLFFYVQGNVFCLAMMESKDMTILGAFQQRNVRVVYDLKGKMFSFAPEDCSKDV